MSRLLGIILVSLFFFVPEVVKADVFESPSELKDAYDQGKEMYDLFKEINEMVDDAENNRTLKAHGTIPKNLVERLNDTASEIQNAKFHTDVDPDDYHVSLADFTACDTRLWASGKIEDYINALQNGKKEGDDFNDQLDHALKANRAMEDIILSLQKDSDKFLANPFLPELNWLWWDLDKIRVGVVNIGNALGERKKQLDGERKRVDTALSNITGNYASLKTVECSIVGKWVGKSETQDNVEPLTVELTKPNGAYQCSANSRPCCNVQISIPDRTVNFDLCNQPDGPVRFVLTIDAAYARMSGRKNQHRNHGTYHYDVSLTFQH